MRNVVVYLDVRKLRVDGFVRMVWNCAFLSVEGLRKSCTNCWLSFYSYKISRSSCRFKHNTLLFLRRILLLRPAPLTNFYRRFILVLIWLIYKSLFGSVWFIRFLCEWLFTLLVKVVLVSRVKWNIRHVGLSIVSACVVWALALFGPFWFLSFYLLFFIIVF